MPKDLAALLAEDGAVPADVVERALARQQEAGGTLDTALLELGAIREDLLAAALARAAELPQAPAAAWRASDARARRVFPSRVAERHGLAPFALDGRELSLVATYPVDLGLLDEISFMLSLHLTAHVGPEWRVRELIHRIYGTPLSPRLEAIAAAVRAAAGTDETPPPPPAPAPDERAEAAEAAGALEHAALPDPPRRAVEPSPRDAPGEPAPRRAPPVPSFGGFGTSDEPMEPLAAALAEALESVDLSEYEEAPSPEEAASPVEGPAAAEGSAPGAVAAEEAEPEEAAPPPDRTAPPRWTLADARAAAGEARHRDEVVLTALRYARDFFEFAAMFAVTRDAVAGHDALGDEEARERARAVAIWANDPGVFRTVIETQSPYLGPVQASAAGTETVLKGLGRTPRTVLVYPIVLRGRPVCILYADNGEAPVSARRLGDLLLFLSTVGATFERIIRDRKKRGRRRPRSPAPSEAAAAGIAAAADAATAAPRASPAARQGSAPEPTSAATRESLAPAAPAASTEAAPAAASRDEAPGAPAAVVESTEGERVSPPPAAAVTDEQPASPAPVAATREEEPVSRAPVAAPREEAPPPAPVAPATQPHRAAARVEATRSRAGHEPGRGQDGAAPEPPEDVRVDDPGAGPRPERERDADEGHVSFANLEAAGEVEQPAPTPASPEREPRRAEAPPAPPQVAPRAPLPPRTAAASPAHRVPSPTDPGRTAIIWPAAVPAGEAEADPWDAAEQAARAAPPAPRSAFPASAASPVAPGAAPHPPPPSQAAPESSAAPAAPAPASPTAAVAAAPPPVHAAPQPQGSPTPAAHAPTAGERTPPPVAPPPDPGSLAALADRALDADPEVAATACAALGSRRRDPGVRPAAEKLRRALLSGIAARAQRAARALAALRDPEAIPLLIQVLETSDPETASAAAAALSAVTLQRLGPDARRWLAWWKENRGRGRAQWLFAALTSPERELRVAASLELSQAAPSPVVYTADMPAPEREKAARTWAGWWARSGHVL